MKFFLLSLLMGVVALLAGGCALRPLKPGWSGIRSASGFVGAVQQSENPKADSTQKYERLPDGTERVETKIGASQKDVAREIGAKLASLRPLIFVGAAVFLFGIASIFWLPLKTIIGSTTTSAAIALAGLVLIVLPTIIVGNEIWIFGGAVAFAAVWFFAIRHGRVRGALEELKR